MAPDKQHSKNALDWWWNVKVDGPQKSECSAGTLPCCGIAMPYGAFERRVRCSVRRAMSGGRREVVGSVRVRWWGVSSRRWVEATC